jgi:crotonobetainyl-CoA:carnitine CoA-transferase CaiB-like acyl-CoA transferase
LAESAGALDGVRIIDATALFAGPLATMMLGDQGADVIKIEPPGGQGDLMRSMGIARGGIASTFHAVNRNKRSIVLDLRADEGREILARLVEGADVFVQNYRPGDAARLGVDEATLRARRADLVYVSLTAWGESGPQAQRPAFDSVMQAASGIAASQAGPDGRPQLVRSAIVDKVTGLNLAQCITAALFARSRTGEGQHVHLNMLDCAVSFLWVDGMQHRTFVGDEVELKNPWMHLLPTRDGWLIMSLNSDESFRNAVDVLGDPSLGKDPRFQSVEARGTCLDQLFDEVEKRTARFGTQELCQRLAQADVPHSAVTALADVERHPQVSANRTLLEDDHPVSGRIRHAAPVADFDGTPSSVRRLAPARGEHTDEILGELGLGPDERATLRKAGVVE